MADLKALGNHIRELRENAGYTKKSIAEFLKVDERFISAIEKGERGLSSDTLDQLCCLFGVTADQLIGDQQLSSLSFAFRGADFTVEEMEAIANINRIALNSEWMNNMLKEDEE